MSIAIVGIGLRFPQAHSPLQFWQILKNEREVIQPFPKSRWDVDQFYHPDPFKPGKMLNRKGGYLDNISEFDWRAFRIPAREAALIDPQQRLLLEVSWEAFEDAGLPFSQVANTQTGVFIGITWNDYFRLQSPQLEHLDGYTATGNLFAFASNRISYWFNLRGPSISLDTGCASSLVATRLACQSLWNHEIDTALVGGVELILSPDSNIICSKTGALSPTESCRALDAQADGFMRGEGAAVVVLKRLTDVGRSDRVYAIIKGAAQNHNGKNEWIMAPSVAAQESVIAEAYRNAKIDPAMTSYVELHGTAFKQGDVIETAAIGHVIGQAKGRCTPCAIGSVKTNIGSLGAAAGIASMIKVAQSLYYQTLPGTLNLTTLNPDIPFNALNLKPQWRTEEWINVRESALTASINCTSINGTNVHLVLQNYQLTTITSEISEEINQSRFYLLLLSARTQASLAALVKEYICFLSDTSLDEEKLNNICYSASVRRSHHEHRLAIVGHDRLALQRHLQAFIDGQDSKSLFSSDRLKYQPKCLSLLLVLDNNFSWVILGQLLFNNVPAFYKIMISYELLFKQHTRFSLLENIKKDSESFTGELLYFILFAFQSAFITCCLEMGIKENIKCVGIEIGEISLKYSQDQLTFEQVVININRLIKKKEKKKSLQKRTMTESIKEISAQGNESDKIYLLLGFDLSTKLLENLPNRIMLLSISENNSSLTPLLEIMALFYQSGYSLNWEILYNQAVKYVDIPKYVWQRELCWPAWLNSLTGSASATIDNENCAFQAEEDEELLALLLTKNVDEQQHVLETFIHQIISKSLSLVDEAISNDVPFMELGFDSLMSVRLRAQLNKTFQIDLYPSVLFDYPTVSLLSHYVLKKILTKRSMVSKTDDNHQNFSPEDVIDPELLTEEELSRLIEERTQQLTALLKRDERV